MGNVAMEEGTDESSPYFVIDCDSGTVLVLKAIEGAVPGDIGLFS